MEQIIKVEIYHNENLPADSQYTASIDEESLGLKHCVTAGTIAECFKELYISMKVIDILKNR